MDILNMAQRTQAAPEAPKPKAPTFLTEYGGNMRERVLAATWVVLDLETTGLHAYDSPVGVNKTSRIGPRTLNQYAMEFPGVTADATLRARILAAQLSDGTKAAWDLDALSADDRRLLFTEVLDEKVIIGHNVATFDMGWARHFTDAQPARILDTMLLVRCLKPSTPFRLHQLAAAGVPDAVDIVKTIQSFAGVSLEHTAVALGHERPVKTFQKPVNWTLSKLSQGHYDYVMSDVDLPLLILKQITGTDTVEAAIAAIDAKAPFYAAILEPATRALVGLHHRGVPLDLETVGAMKARYVAEIAAAAAPLLEIPEFAPWRTTLEVAAISVPDGLKEAWAAYAARHDLILPRTATGKVQMDAKGAKTSGLSNLPAWSTWLALQQAKKRLQMLSEYEDLSAPDSHPSCASESGLKRSRLHPLIGINAATLRTSSQAPNTQNPMAAIRASIRARPGHKIVSIDYSAIELRIGAALAVRAIREAEAVIADPRQEAVKSWVRDALIEATKGPVYGPEPPRPIFGKAEPDEWVRYNGWHLARAYRNVIEQGTPMARVFQMNLDGHLLTALPFAARKGLIDLDGQSAIDFLAALPPERQAELKVELATERKNAKAVNFGAIYGQSSAGLHTFGIQSYGVQWTLEEATAARSDWFALYPDMGFWQLWTKLTKKYTRNVAMFKRFYKDEDGNDVPRLVKEPMQLYLVKTLDGAPIVASSLIDALNYPDQRTGAHIALGAIGHLPYPAADYLTNFVHDELVLEVPDDELDLVIQQTKDTMLHWADKMLAPYGIPSDCEAAVAEVWQH